MLQKLNGARVLVIGGSSGIGFATARMAHDAGAKVTLASRSGERLRQAAARIGAGVETEVVDICDEASVRALFSGAPYDHVVVTASQVRIAPVRELPLEEA